MMRHSRMAALVGLVIVIGGPSLAQEGGEADKQALRDIKAVFEQAAAENAMERMQPHLHEPFSVVTYTDREFSDFEAFNERWKQTRAEVVGETGSYQVTLKPEPTLFFGDIAIATGDSDNVLVAASGNEYRFTSHWTAVFRKVDGEWKIVRAHSSLDPFGNPIVVGEATRRVIQIAIATAVIGLLLGAIGGYLVGGRRSRPAAEAPRQP